MDQDKGNGKTPPRVSPKLIGIVRGNISGEVAVVFLSREVVAVVTSIAAPNFSWVEQQTSTSKKESHAEATWIYLGLLHGRVRGRKQ